MKSPLIFLAACLLIGCSCKKSEPQKAGEMKNVPLTQEQKSVIGKSNAFGFAFFQAMQPFAGADKNLMVSPLSISMALGMTRNGAAGSTLDSMTRVLGFEGLGESEINSSYQYIMETFSGLDPGVQVSVANSIWYRNTFTVEQSFTDVNKNYFSAIVTPLDFSDPGSVTTINNWVSAGTKNLIPKIVESIPADMVMYLINAVYFKGKWRHQFEKENTAPKPFRLADGSDVQTPSMLQQCDLPYFDGDGFEAVELPYNQGNFVMTILLPETGSSPAAVIATLSQGNWDTWSGNFATTDVVLQLPKFKYEYDEQAMIPILTAMGMGGAFDDQLADFTRINSNGGLYISEVKHKTYIETNEEGTEAAAVTSVGISVTSAGPGSTVYFTVDRPFVYFITEKSTGTILFIGTVVNPAVN